jgi:branched-subunit amino acid aminotransferase/4-amino-4-deoxychorismate lyase
VNTAPRAWLHENGVWTPDATLPVTDRAMRYGMAVFETIGIRSGHPLLLAEHLALLEESARTLLSTPVGSAGLRLGEPAYGSESLSGPLPKLHNDDTGILRLYLTAGDGTPTAPVTTTRLFALFEPHDPTTIPHEQNARLHPEPVTPFGHGRKTANYWMNCAAQSAAQVAGFDHALLSDHHGHLLSAAFGNLFFVLDGQVCTPSLSLAVRPGVIRAWVMQQQPVHEVEFSAARLAEATELFLTNSRLGVMPLRCGAVSAGSIGRSLRATALREKIVP